MSLKFRIFLFASAIVFIVGATFSFSSFFAKVVGFQPIQPIAFKDSSNVSVLIFNESEKTSLILDNNKFYLKNELDIKLPIEVYKKILSIKLPQVRREAFFDGFAEEYNLKTAFLTFKIEDNLRQELLLEFYKESEDKIKLRVKENIPIGNKNDINTYFSIITKDDNLLKIVNLIKNINKGEL